MYKPKVFYTASYEGKKYYQKEYDQISSILKKLDIELIGTEIGNYKQLLTESDKQRIKNEDKLHYLAIAKGIAWADILILELSQESFHVGHEATLALERKKPVLGLSKVKDWSERITHPYFTGKKYSQYTVEGIIKDFLESYTKAPLTERFNLFLSKLQIDKLERKAKEESLNMSEYIRKLIEQS